MSRQSHLTISWVCAPLLFVVSCEVFFVSHGLWFFLKYFSVCHGLSWSVLCCCCCLWSCVPLPESRTPYIQFLSTSTVIQELRHFTKSLHHCVFWPPLLHRSHTWPTIPCILFLCNPFPLFSLLNLLTKPLKAIYTMHENTDEPKTETFGAVVSPLRCPLFTWGVCLGRVTYKARKMAEGKYGPDFP